MRRQGHLPRVFLQLDPFFGKRNNNIHQFPSLSIIFRFHFLILWRQFDANFLSSLYLSMSCAGNWPYHHPEMLVMPFAAHVNQRAVRLGKSSGRRAACGSDHFAPALLQGSLASQLLQLIGGAFVHPQAEHGRNILELHVSNQDSRSFNSTVRLDYF